MVMLFGVIVVVRLNYKMEKTLIEEIKLGEHDFYLDEIDEVLNDEGVELRDFELCNQETQNRIEDNIKLALKKAKEKENGFKQK